MRIRLKCQRVGAFGSQAAGEIIDVAEQEAARLVTVGQAVYVDGQKSVVESTALASQLREHSPRTRVKRIHWT